MTASPIDALLDRVAAGDHTALGEVYDRYAGLVNGLALRILRNSPEAEEVVQEVFVPGVPAPTGPMVLAGAVS
jgi:RNA polymerase sigma-70 factor (ECF subfamily)